MTKKPGALVVDVPNPSADQPSWLRVGAFAIVGLVVGIGWPKVFGIRLGPSAPAAVAEAGSSTASSARPSEPPPSLPASVAAANPNVAGSGANAAADTGGGTVDVKHGLVVSCTSDSGERLKGSQACGSVDFDSIALPRLKKLAHCPTADGADGKLSVLFALDFESNKVNVSTGRTTTVENKDTFEQCIRTAFDNVSLGALAHDNKRYLVSYAVRFAPHGSITPAAGGDSAAATQAPTAASTPQAAVASDSAQVVWEVAIVRDSPRTGNVVGRLPRGTSVQLAGNESGWYRVKYGNNNASEGWVYRGAVGK
ncbi:MAG TPA: SH3 domain-containing protein [Polyangiaceae bacterium]